MAINCTKCGASVALNEQSCPSCGAATDAANAVAVCIPLTAVPGKSDSGTLKIILITVAVIVGLGILGLGAIGFIGYRIAKNTHVDSNGRMTMNTPAGSITATPDNNIKASDLGVDIYPGAEPAHQGMRMDTPNASGVQLEFLTSDSPAQVLAFYKSKLGSTAVVVSLFGHSTARLQISKLEYVQVKIAANSKRDNGKTRISIVRMKKNPS